MTSSRRKNKLKSFFKSVHPPTPTQPPLKFKLSEQENETSKKRRAVGLSFFVVVKRIAALQVFSLLHFAMLEEKTSLMVTANQQPETS